MGAKQKAKDEEIAISVEGVSKTFKLPHEKQSSLKGLFLSSFRKKRYEMQHAVQDVSFQVKKGEFFGIVGRNGSGKSTLLKLIAGIYTPDKGTITVNGILTPFIELGVGFNPELSGRDNVFLNGALFGKSRKEMEALYDEIVAFAELERFMDQKLKNYSSGMQVRLAFSIAIQVQSDILLLDEVLAVGDSAFQQKCFNYFEELKQNKKTVVLVTHAMDSIKRFCNRGILIENGVIKKIGTSDEIADQYLLDNINSGTKSLSAKPSHNTNVKLTEYVSHLSLKLLSRKSLYSKDELCFQIQVTIEEKFNPAVAFTITKYGVSVAEVNTLDIQFSNESKKLIATYKTPLKSFNAGAYSIDAAVIDKDNKTLRAYRLKAEDFIVKGNNPTKGGIINLDGEWVVD